MRTIILACFALLALSGCGDKPLTVYKPVEVDVKVPVKCHDKMPATPVWAMTKADPNADIAAQGKAALVELEQRQGYEDQLQAQIQACN